MRVRKGSKQGEEEKREMMEAGYLIIAKVGKLRMASSFRFRWRMTFPGSKAFLQMGERGQTEHAESRPVTVSIGIFFLHINKPLPPGRRRRRTRTKLGLRLAALGGVYRLCRAAGARCQEQES